MRTALPRRGGGHNPKGEEKMTIGELRERLGEYPDDMYVKIALQPSWPLAAPAIEAVCRIGETLWIAAGPATEYAPSAAWKGEDLDEDGD